MLKSGCKVEASRLRTAPRPVILIATCCVLAWRVFWMAMISRSGPDAAPTVALTQLELDLFDHLVPKSLSADRKALSDYIVKLARLGVTLFT